jgi:hypothetical protein
MTSMTRVYRFQACDPEQGVFRSTEVEAYRTLESIWQHGLQATSEHIDVPSADVTEDGMYHPKPKS